MARGEKVAETIATIQEKNFVSKDYSNVKTYQDALKEARLAWEVGMDDILDKRIIVMQWTPDARVVPQTKQRTQGYMMDGEFEETGEKFTVFVGGNVLVKELTALEPPFRTVVRRSGQTYRFS